MDSALIRRTGAFLSGSRAVAVLVAAILLVASSGAAEAASLAINNQATKPVTVKAFSGSSGSCAPQVANNVLPSATLTMACPIREGISRYPDASILGWPL